MEVLSGTTIEVVTQETHLLLSDSCIIENITTKRELQFQFPLFKYPKQLLGIKKHIKNCLLPLFKAVESLHTYLAVYPSPFVQWNKNLHLTLLILRQRAFIMHHIRITVLCQEIDFLALLTIILCKI